MYKDVPEGFRKCAKCKENKPLNRDTFYYKKADKHGFHYSCIDCEKKRAKNPGRVYRLTPEERTVSRRLNFYHRKDKDKDNIVSRTFIKDSLLKPCIYCGFPSTGLDRIDNKIGHTEENCIPACKECNIARMDNFTVEEMKLIGETIRLIKMYRILSNK